MVQGKTPRTLRPSPRGAYFFLGVAARLLLGVAAPIALGAGCTNLRYFTTYRYESPRLEIEKVPLKEKESLVGLFKDSRGWFLRVMELRRCEQREVEVSEEIARITVTSPTWLYFVGLGALQASLSAPFWALGARAEGPDRRNHFLVGSLVFLAPGLAILGVGAYFRLVSGTEERRMGQRRRVKGTAEVDCGVEAAGGKQVTLGTRTGHVRLGKTDAQGLIPFPVETGRPLVRWEGGRPVKAYFEVFVEDNPAQEVRLPKDFPVQGGDLLEPNLKPTPSRPTGAPDRPSPRPR